MPGVDLKKVLFFIVRHGETAGNQKSTYRGWSNGPDAQLDAAGRKDADEAGRYLLAAGASVELVITDALDRTQETAERIAASFPNARIITVRTLHPLDVGDWTGEAKDAHPVEPYLNSPKKKIPGGESLNDFNGRQQGIFKSIFDLVGEFPGGQMVVVAHGSNVAYLFNHVFNTGEERVGYEGLVDPGGVIAATTDGLVPLTKVREPKKGLVADKDFVPVPKLVALEPWALGYVIEKQIGRKPASCLTCHMWAKRQKRCMVLGPDIVIDVLNISGKTYTPVCGELYDYGKPFDGADDEVMYPAAVNGAEKADQIGLEWAEGAGTNCGGKNGGATCVKHYTGNKKEGFCRPLQREVYAGDCCTAHEGPALAWREAQFHLKKEDQ